MKEIVNRLNRMRLQITCFAIAAILLVGGFAVPNSISGANAIAALIWSVSMLPLAVTLYWVRRTNRIVFGTVELAAGFGLLYFAILNAMVRENLNFTALVTERTLLFLAAIYLMVQGLGNVGDGLNSNSPIGRQWNQLFPSSAP